MPHKIHQIARSLVHSVPFLPESRITNLASKLSPAEDEDVETTLKDGPKMLVNMRELSGFHIYVRGHHQPYVLDYFRDFLQPGMVMMDIGAHFGLFTLVAGHKVGPSGKVHAFEPGATQWRFLTHNIQLNHYGDRVVANHVALGAEPGTIGYEPGGAGNLGASHVSETASLTVPLITLDDYCRDNAVTQLDAIKMDVEGYELRVLQGFERSLTELKPRLIAYECDEKSCREQGYASAEVHRFFDRLGYVIHKARGGGILPPSQFEGAHWQNDFIAKLP